MMRAKFLFVRERIYKYGKEENGKLVCGVGFELQTSVWTHDFQNGWMGREIDKCIYMYAYVFRYGVGIGVCL